MNAREQNSEAIESEIEQTRSRIDDTISAIEHKLSPGQLLDEGLNYFRRSGTGEFASNLGDNVKRNPMPVALVGLGVGWLMMSNSSMGGVSSMSARGKASDAAGQARDKAENMAAGARERAARVKDSARTIGSRASDNARRASGRTMDFMHEQPLVMGVLGIALGAILGASLPATEREDELMGAARDDVVDKAAEAGREQTEKVKSAAHAATDAARREADQQGLTSPGP